MDSLLKSEEEFKNEFGEEILKDSYSRLWKGYTFEMFIQDLLTERGIDFYGNPREWREWLKYTNTGYDLIIIFPFSKRKIKVEIKYLEKKIYPSWFKRDWESRSADIFVTSDKCFIPSKLRHRLRIFNVSEFLTWIDNEIKKDQSNEYFINEGNKFYLNHYLNHDNYCLNYHPNNCLNNSNSLSNFQFSSDNNNKNHSQTRENSKLQNHSINLSKGKELVYAFRESMTFQEKKENTKLIDGCKPIKLYMANTRCWYCREEVDIDNDPFWTFVGYLEDGTPYVALDSNLNEGLLCMKCVLSHWKLNKREDHPNWRKYLYLLFKKFEFQHMSLVYKGIIYPLIMVYDSEPLWSFRIFGIRREYNSFEFTGFLREVLQLPMEFFQWAIRNKPRRQKVTGELDKWIWGYKS